MSCGITSSSLADYSNQLRHFARTNEFVGDVEVSIQAMPMETTGDELTEEDQAVLDSEENNDGDENDNGP